MSTALASRLLAHLRSQQSQMVDLLKRLALLESPSLSPATQGPVFDLLASELASAGYRVRRLPGRATGGQILAVPAARRKEPRGRPARLQLVLGHADTVWEEGTLSRMPVAASDGRLSGPGVFDMKGGLVQAVFALRALAELGLEPPATPVVLVNSDEELGSDESIPVIVRLARRVQRVFVLEPSLGPEGKLKTARKGVGRYRITVHGRASHAGLAPEEGASAIVELAHLVLFLEGLNDRARGITVNTGTITGGVRGNVVPPEATAEVDVRVTSQADGEAITRAIVGLADAPRQVPGTRVEVEVLTDRAPLERTPRNRVLWEQALAAAGELGLPLAEGSVGGGSDGNITSRYTATLDGLGAVGDGAHADHEFVYVDRLPERAALLALLLLAPLPATVGEGA
jgi:glutamate carboxypeptidase